MQSSGACSSGVLLHPARLLQLDPKFIDDRIHLGAIVSTLFHVKPQFADSPFGDCCSIGFDPFERCGLWRVLRGCEVQAGIVTRHPSQHPDGYDCGEEKGDDNEDS